MPISSPSEVNISQKELDSARLELLRRRIARLGLVVGTILLGVTALQAWVALGVLHRPLNRTTLTSLATGALASAAFIVMPRIRRARFAKASLRRLSWRTMMLVLVATFGQLPGAAVLANGLTESLRPLGFEGQLGPMIPLSALLMCIHTAAALTVPWTTIEACVPPALLALVSFVLSNIQGGDDPSFQAYGAVVPLLSGLPGIAISAFRSHGLREVFGLRLIGERYAEVERELGTARRIHERLFPAPVTAGPLRLSYRYEPMRQIGGDFLDVAAHSDGSLVVTLIDVTGHGVAAALAVNRLHGELKRTIAQHDNASPVAIIEALNEYIFLTLADEQVFATAIALRASPEGAVSMCVAGHPPAMIRRTDGRLEQFDSTTPALGMLPSRDLDAQESTCQLSPGDLLLLYTDGAIEIWDDQGRQLGIDGLKRAVTAARPAAGDADSLADSVMRTVDGYRAGPVDDDTLVVVIARA